MFTLIIDLNDIISEFILLENVQSKYFCKNTRLTSIINLQCIFYFNASTLQSSMLSPVIVVVVVITIIIIVITITIVVNVITATIIVIVALQCAWPKDVELWTFLEVIIRLRVLLEPIIWSLCDVVVWGTWLVGRDDIPTCSDMIEMWLKL